MKLVCEGLDLSDAVLKVIRATATKTTNMALGGIKLSAREDVLILTSTDLEISIEKTIPADVKIQGEVVVPGKIFAELVKKISNEQIELAATENKLSIKYLDSEISLQCLNLDDFPQIVNTESIINKTINVNKTEFKKMIDKTIFCVAIDDSRPILKGCLLELENKKLISVALDGYRMATYKINVETDVEKMKCVVPAKSLNEISKLLITPNKEECIKIYFGDKYMMINDNNTKIISKLLEGEFINYTQVIPKNSSTSILINKQQFENGLERASLLSRAEKNSLVKFDIEENLLTLSSASSIGKVNEKINISLEGKNLTIAFNSKYISDCIGNISEEFVRVNFGSETAPCTITSTENNEFLYLILPVRIVE